MSQEDDVDVTPLSHNPFSYPQARIEHKRSYLWAEKPMGSLNSDWFLQKIGQIWVESNSSKSLASLRVSSAKLGTLKPGTLKQSQFRSLVVKAASVIAPKSTSIKPLGDRILVKIKEAEEKTMGGILLPSTGQRSRRQRRRQWEVSYFYLQVNRNLKEVKSLLWPLLFLRLLRFHANIGLSSCGVDWSTNHLLHKYAGTEVEFNDVKHLILKEDDIGLS
ncbi:hypothetical protein HID58_066996 [Brassica napus]|uniref:Uncharacterized protein n=1 Tax=Brassica napus TaxID=3708 RepID=A0ABQ7ZHA6_BRANA|nr:hypothetical protein HID58_066996 [Brassica napus]